MVKKEVERLGGRKRGGGKEKKVGHIGGMGERTGSGKCSSQIVLY